MSAWRWMLAFCVVALAACGETVPEVTERSLEDRQKAAARFQSADLGGLSDYVGAVFSHPAVGEASITALPEEEKLRITYLSYRTRKGKLERMHVDLEPLGGGEFALAVPNNRYGSSIRNYRVRFDATGRMVVNQGATDVVFLHVGGDALHLSYWPHTNSGLKEVRLQRDYFARTHDSAIPFDVSDSSPYQDLIRSNGIGTWNQLLGQSFIHDVQPLNVVASDMPSAFYLEYRSLLGQKTSETYVDLNRLQRPAVPPVRDKRGYTLLESGVLPSGLVYWSLDRGDDEGVVSTYMRNHGDRFSISVFTPEARQPMHVRVFAPATQARVAAAKQLERDRAEEERRRLRALSEANARREEEERISDQNSMAFMRGLHQGLAAAQSQIQRDNARSDQLRRDLQDQRRRAEADRERRAEAAAAQQQARAARAAAANSAASAASSAAVVPRSGSANAESPFRSIGPAGAGARAGTGVPAAATVQIAQASAQQRMAQAEQERRQAQVEREQELAQRERARAEAAQALRREREAARVASAENRQHELQAHLDAERRAIRLGARQCSGSVTIIGTRPTALPVKKVANMICVDYEALCPGQREGQGHRGRLHNFISDTMCGTTNDLPRNWSCEAKDTRVLVRDVVAGC